MTKPQRAAAVSREATRAAPLSRRISALAPVIDKLRALHLEYPASTLP